MLSRAAESIGLHYRRPPSPERSRLDDWFLRAQAERRQPPPVPFFPEVHEEVTRSWKAPFSARSRPSASSVLTTLDGGAAQGYVEVPPVERAIAMQLCPQGAAAWRGNPRLPSRACKFSSTLTAKAYGAAGQAASSLHAMALLQVHQAKALKQLHEGDADPGVLQELRTATDLALRATKVTAWALGQTMSTLVVQERHLWLTLADMRESDKHRFLDSQISLVGLFGEAVEDLPNSSPPHRSRWRRFASCPGGPLLSPPHRRLQPLCLLVAEGALLRPPPPLQLGHNSSLHNGRSMELAAGKRRGPPTAPAKPVKGQGRRRPWDGRPGASGSCSSGDGDSTTPSPGGGPGGEFLFCSATGPRVSGTQKFIRAVSFFSGSQEGEDGSARDPVSTFPSPSLFASGQQGPVRGRDAFSRAPCPAVETGECCTTHSDPTSRRSAFRVGPLGSTALPHRGYVYVSPGPACTAPGGLARAPQAVSLAPEDHQTRLRDSVRPASSQVQGQSVHLSVEPGCPCLACRSCGPTGEGRDTAGPLQPRWSQGSTKAPTSSFPRNTVGYIQSGTCVFWTGPLSSSRSRCWRRDASFNASVPSIGLQRSTWKTPTSMSRSSLDSALRTKGEHTSRPSPSGTSAGWGFRSTGKRANFPLCRGSLFSAGSWTRSTSQHVSQRSVLSQCWDAWSLSSARGRFHWNIFRGSWGIWHPQPLSRRSDCFIWDRFSVGFTTESRDGHGTTAHTGSHSPRPAVAPSAHGRILPFFGQKFP